MTSNQHGPYVRGDTRVTMAATEGAEAAMPRESEKGRLSSRISHGAVNTFPGLVHTARQAMGVGSA